MRFNHLNLTVTDVTAAREFLETYFDMRCEATRGSGFALMSDDDGFVLTLMKGKEVNYPKTFHIGFSQESKDHVDRINQRLKDGGFDVRPPEHVHGSYTIYVHAPGGFMVEVPC